MTDQELAVYRAGMLAALAAIENSCQLNSGKFVSSAAMMNLIGEFRRVVNTAAARAVPEGYVLVPVEPTEHDLWRIMIAGEMDIIFPKASGLARAKAARNAMLAAVKP